MFKNSCSDASFENCSDPNGMSLTQVLTVVRAMAKFHAAGRAFLARNRTQVTPSLLYQRCLISIDNIKPISNNVINSNSGSQAAISVP